VHLVRAICYTQGTGSSPQSCEHRVLRAQDGANRYYMFLPKLKFVHVEEKRGGKKQEQQRLCNQCLWVEKEAGSIEIFLSSNKSERTIVRQQNQVWVSVQRYTLQRTEPLGANHKKQTQNRTTLKHMHACTHVCIFTEAHLHTTYTHTHLADASASMRLDGCINNLLRCIGSYHLCAQRMRA